MEATIDLIEVEGFASLTMQKIAETAGINVAAVYSYFPNKHQVVSELNNRLVQERYVIRNQDYEGILQKDADWADAYAESLRGLARMLDEQRGNAALTRAMYASPPLWELHRKNHERVEQRMMDFLDKVDPGYAKGNKVRAKVLASVISTVLELSQTEKDVDAGKMLDELVKLVRNYLKSC
ncbi:MAG: TetR/AcrR family transcriptional regulator [Rhizobiaceae bacterium]|nr:TetR/AcrR family transcriptional regulator [Rhizobiaceae bacterium]